MSFEDIRERIEALPADWHGSGPLSSAVLRTIAMYCSQIGPIAHSVETGAGKSTLFFSQVSQHHVVFAIDIGKSLSRVKTSSLFFKDCVQIIEGQTQSTLPRYEFQKKIPSVLFNLIPDSLKLLVQKYL